MGILLFEILALFAIVIFKVSDNIDVNFKEWY